LLLNFIGLPLLYRVVDLTGYEAANLGRAWKPLFGEEGLFSESRKGGRGEEEGEGEVHRRKVEGGWVRKLLLGSVATNTGIARKSESQTASCWRHLSRMR